MISKFTCPKCHSIFESEGRKDEYISATYGPCFKYVADCPTCGTESNEYRSPAKKQTVASNQPACGTEGCCCYN